MKKETYEAKLDISDIKRLYLPGLVIKKKCTCGEVMEYDFGDNYLSFAEEDKPIKLYFECRECENEYTLTVKANCKVFIDVVDELKGEKINDMERYDFEIITKNINGGESSKDFSCRSENEEEAREHLSSYLIIANLVGSKIILKKK